MPNENFRDADSRDASPETIALTIEAMGIDVDRYAGHPALDLIAYDVKAGLESGLSPSSDILRIIQDYVDFHGTGDKVLDTLQVIENLEVLEDDEVYHRFPEGFDIKAFENPWAGAAAAAIAGADLSDGFDGFIDSIPIMDCIDTGKLSDLLIERGCGAVDKDGWVTRAGKDYETAAGALAACGIPEMAADIDSAMGLELGGDATARAYIEERLSIDGLDDIIDSSSTESVTALAYALTMVSDEEAHGIDLYCKAAGTDIDGAAGIACVAATMAKLGAEEFGYVPCRGIEEARYQFCNHHGSLVGRSDLMASVDLDRMGEKLSSTSILLEDGWAETRDADYACIDLDAEYEPDFETHPAERSILWSRTEPVVSADIADGCDLSSAEGWRELVQAVRDELSDRGDIAIWPSCWGDQVRIEWLENGRGIWAPLDSVRDVCGGEWAAEAWSAVAHGDMTAEAAADAWSRGDFTAFEVASDLHGAWAPAIYPADPQDLDDAELRLLASTRPDLFDDKSCNEHPLLAQARSEVGNLWIIGDGDETVALTDDQAKSYFETHPDLEDMREAGSTWRDWVGELEDYGMCSNAYGPGMREQQRAEASSREDGATERASAPRTEHPLESEPDR